MPVFTDKMQLQDCFTALFSALRSDPDIGPRAQASGLVVRFLYADPNTSVIIDCRPSPLSISWDQEPVLTNEERSKLFVDLSMSADTAHRFWLGRVNLVAAITRGIIKAKGPIPSIMRFLPIIKPAFAIYPRILEEKGLEHLITA
jgi:hypothetical protein